MLSAKVRYGSSLWVQNFDVNLKYRPRNGLEDRPFGVFRYEGRPTEGKPVPERAMGFHLHQTV